MSEPTPEQDHPTDETTADESGETGGEALGSTRGPSDDELPGHRGDGPDPDPVDAAEAEGGEVGAG